MNKKTIFLFLFIICLAGFLRLNSLDSIPPGLWPDEAINANDGLNHPGKVFYPENNGREGLFINLISLSFKLFEPTLFSLRLVSALIGIFTVVGLFFLARELFSDRVALLASFFLSTSFWHLNFSRIAFRGIMLPLILVFSFYFLFKAFRKRSAIYSFLAGLFFGLGFYTYSSFRLAPFIFLIVFFLFWLRFKKDNEEKNFLKITFYFLITSFIVVLPLLFYFFLHPSDFFGRLGQVSVFSQKNPIGSFLFSFLAHLFMFNFSGDPNWRHNFSGSPQLFWPVGLFFLFGFFLSLKELFLSIKRKDDSLIVYCLLFAWFFFMILPGALTIEGIPHSLRTIGLIPVVYIFSALGIDYVLRELKKKNFSFFFNYFFYFIFFLFLFLDLKFEYQKYFKLWAKNPAVREAFTQRLVEIGLFINNLPEGIRTYVIVNEGGVPVPYPDGPSVMAQTVMFIERTKYPSLRAFYLKPEEINDIQNTERAMIVIPLLFNEDIFQKIKNRFPRANVYQIDNIKFFGLNLDNIDISVLK